MTDKKKELLSLAILLLIAAYLRPFPDFGVMGRDETSYAFLIKHFVDGTFLEDYIFTAFHPFYSLISSPLAASGVDPELAGKIVSYTFGVLTVIPVYLTGKILFSRIAAFSAGFMTATFPVLSKWAGIVQGQTTFSFMLLMSLFFLVVFFKTFLKRYALLSGLFISLAYLTRAEGIGVFAGSVVLFFIMSVINSADSKKILVGLVIFVVSFFVFAAPYVYALKLKTGETKLTNKLFTQIRAAVIVSYELDYEKYNYGKADMPEREIIKMAIKVYPGKILEALKSFPNYFGTIGMLLFIIPVITRFFIGVTFRNYIFFVPYLYVLLVLPFFFVAENYFIPYAPIVFLISGHGVQSLNQLFETKIKKFSFAIIAVFLLFLVAYENVLHYRLKTFFVEEKNIFNMQSAIYTAYRDFGRKASHLIKRDSRIMTRFNIGAWYSGGEFIQFPDVNWEEFLSLLKREKVEYLIIGPAEMDMRPEIYNEIFWRIKQIIKDDRFKVVMKSVEGGFFEFYLIKVDL